MAGERRSTRIAALADLHYGRVPPAQIQRILTAAAERADVLVICGDLTDTGHPDEARQLAREFAAIKIPTVAVLGNHDHEMGQPDQIKAILGEAGVRVLDGDSYEIQGIGFAGVKGFCGGFGRGALGPWGEPMVKAFVHEAVNEALKLETALSRLRTPHRIALLHYAPVRDTTEGEPLEILPYLGSSRLEEPLNRYQVGWVLHGHAHHGSPEGRTAAGATVYNVSIALLERLFPDRPPFRLLELAPPD